MKTDIKQVGCRHRRVGCLRTSWGVRAFAGMWWGVLLTPWAPGGVRTLPVYLADNHAESFGWIVRTFDVDRPHVMVLVDAHCDASAVERSEEIREGLRRVPSEEARRANVLRWREEGRIQAYNWIEPLMPRPVDRVCWLAGWDGTRIHRDASQREAVDSLDGRLEVEPRSVGSLAGRWMTVTGESYGKWHPGSKPVILAVDLDFFSGMAEGVREQVFESIWTRALDWPGLVGVAFSVSRPWLQDDREADGLVRMASAAVMRTRGAVLEVDVSLDDRPDDSMRRSKSSEPLPRWDVARASAGLLATWSMLSGRIRIVDRKRVWQGECGFPAPAPGVRLRPERGEMDCDGVWRFALGDLPVLRVDFPQGGSGRVRWYALEPARPAYDLVPETGLGKGFAFAPGRWVYESRRFLAETADLALSVASIRAPGAGRMRVEAEVETVEGWIPVAPVELRWMDGDGFRGALSECFGMPYVFGVAEVSENEMSGVESGWGSDCANLLIHAWRRNGVALEWGDPGRLRSQLATMVEHVTLDHAVKIRADQIRSGVAVDFGRHVAALWEDREPVGVLDGGDLAVHHLGGYPEIVAISELTRGRPGFSLRVPKESTSVCRVKIAGDVVLTGGDARIVEGFHRGDADVLLANLEGVPSDRQAGLKPRVDFRFPVERLAWLRQRGVDAVSLANNHARDAGQEGLLETIARLRAAGISVFGAGQNDKAACRPWRVERNGVSLAVFGVCLVDTISATDHGVGVARLPKHAEILEEQMAGARHAGCQLVVMVHGGDEYKGRVNEDQRRWARWLVARGARVIAGAHPHVIQRQEWHGGAVVAHSLGNAVYPVDLGRAASGVVRVFAVGK